MTNGLTWYPRYHKMLSEKQTDGKTELPHLKHISITKSNKKKLIINKWLLNFGVKIYHWWNFEDVCNPSCPKLKSLATFCSLQLVRCTRLRCPSEFGSEWVSECNNRIRALNKLCRFRSDVPRSLKLPRRCSFLQQILQKCCLVKSSGPAWLNTIF